VLAIALPMLHNAMASPPAYAMVGMAAVLAASVRAPLTAILLLFELTHDYRIVLPLMAAVGLSNWAIEILSPLVVIDNTPKPLPPEPPLLPGTLALTVSESMHPLPLQLPGTMPLLEAGNRLVGDRCRSALIMEDEQIIGILTLHDFHRLLLKAKADPSAVTNLHQPVKNFCTTELLYVHADELLSEAIARMSARGLQQLPVVTRDHPCRLLGLLDAEDIALAQTLPNHPEPHPETHPEQPHPEQPQPHIV
jgi:CBS domain-containing protein